MKNKILLNEKSISSKSENDVCTSVFVSVPRPISFIKGDMIFIHEIEEESIRKYSSTIISSTIKPEMSHLMHIGNETGGKYNKSLTFKAGESHIEESKLGLQGDVNRSILFFLTFKVTQLDSKIKILLYLRSLL